MTWRTWALILLAAAVRLAVGLEQRLELARGLLRRDHHLLLVVLDGVLAPQRRLVVLAEDGDAAPGLRRRRAERLQDLNRHLETRDVGLADDVVHTDVHEAERVLAVAGPREDLHLRVVPHGDAR